MPFVRLLLQFSALMAGSAAITALLFAYREQHRKLALRYLLFLGSLWLIVFAFGLTELSAVVDSPGLFLVAAFIYSLGSIGYIVVAPFFYHSVLGAPMTPWTRRSYLVFDILVLFFVLGLGWERYRGLAVIFLHVLVFAMVLYGIALVALRYRYLTETPLRWALRVFVALSLVFFPPMYWEARPAEIAPLLRNDWLDGVALPVYYLILTLVSFPFISRYLNRPAYARKGEPTPFFLKEFDISEQEAEIVRLLLLGHNVGEIADRLVVSQTRVENQISDICQKSRVNNRLQLYALLRANK